ncbi:MAG: TonB-dependent receptor [Tannerellaceae bacterium]|jgi:outer membrane receptor for ferrienterochelin and colicin|nr:TonB-dependent receptor [Tannerellaceae bacterium]
MGYNLRQKYRSYGIAARDATSYLCRKFRQMVHFRLSFYSILAVLFFTAPFIPLWGQELDSIIQLEAVEVSARRAGTILSSTTLLKTENITHTGLTKMACCNLSESFENSASANIAYTDAVSGAKQIQLLGLAGVYTQTLAENIPVLRGLASTYGWSYVPSSWLESIQIAKGASSVVNGYEAVAGQINLEFRKPNASEPLYADVYADDLLHFEANVAARLQVGEKLWTGLMLHGTQSVHPASLADRHDRNRDHFLDVPKTRNINLYNRWFYLDEERGIQSRTGVKFVYDDRRAGQDSTCHDVGSSGIPLFESPIRNTNLTLYNKTGFTIGDTPGTSLGIINNFTRHEQQSAFGRKTFNGVQNSYYANVLYTSFLGTTDHRYTVGASFAYDRYDTEFLDSLAYNQTPLTRIGRTEIVPGAFAEYTFSGVEKLTVVAGLRIDYNSRYGWLFTPRANLKYDVGEYAVVRASAGRGFRSANVIAENIGLLASSRQFDLSDIDNLDIERAWNFGGNLVFYIPVWDERRATLSLDYFHTRFQNQAIADIERDRNAVFFYNLDGQSYANAWQADLSLNIIRGLDLFAAFRFNNNRITYSEGSRRYEVEKPLVTSSRGLVNLSYATALKRWVFDVTAQLNGQSRLPGLNGYDSQKRYSPAYPVYFAQITKNSKRFDFYIGAENLLDYKQPNPIVGWENPFQRDFDASMIWGPLVGRKIYCGIRLRIGELF